MSNPSATREDSSHSKSKADERLKQLELIRNAKVGSDDWAGQKITAIFGKAESFLVYRAEGDRDDDSLRIFVADVDDEIERTMIENYDKIQLELFHAYATVPKSRNPMRILRKIAIAIAMVLSARPDAESTFEGARAICNKVADQVNDEYQKLIKGKILYLTGCASIVAILSIMSIAVFYFRKTELINNFSYLVPMLYSAAVASHGGFVSVSTALNRLDFEPELRNVDYMAYGFTRIFVSVLGGVFVFMVIKSGLVLNFVPASSFYGVLVFCFAAGFSEKLVPDLLKKLETHNEDKDK
jgi:hypothetical protein